MAQTLDTLVVKLEADVAGLRRDLDRAANVATQKADQMSTSFGRAGKALSGLASDATQKADQMSTSFGRAGKALGGLALAGGALFATQQALGGVAAAAQNTARFISDLAVEAQRSQNAMLVFGKQIARNNLDFDEAQGLVNQLSKRFGVLPETVMEATTLMLRAGASLDDVSRALTAAGASAAAGGTDITMAFDNVSVAVATGRSELLETSGIVANLGPAQQKYAKEIGKTVEQLTSQELIQARVNAIYEESKAEIEDVDELLSGLTGNTSRVTAEMARLRIELGEVVLPIVTKLAGSFANLVGGLNDLIERFKQTPVEKAASDYKTLQEKVAAAAGSQEALEQLLKETGDRLVDDTGRTAYQATMEAIEADSKTAAEAVDLLTAALQAQVEAQRQALLTTINEDAIANAEAVLGLQERIALAQETVRQNERVTAGQAQRVKEEEALIAAGTPTGQLPNLQTNLAQGLQAVRDSQARLDALLEQLAALEAARLEIERARVEVIRPDLVDTIFGPARAPTTGPATDEGNGGAGGGADGAGDAEAKTGEAARPLTLAEMRTEFQEMMLGPLRQDAAQRENALYRLLLNRPGLRMPGAPDVALPRSGAGFGLPSLSAPQGVLEAPTLPTTLEVLAILDEAILSRAGNIAVEMMEQPLFGRYRDIMERMLPPGSLLPGAGPLPDRNTIEGFARAIEEESQRILLARTGYGLGITDPSIGILSRSLAAPSDALQRTLESLPAPRLRGIPGLSIPLAGEVTQSRDIGLPRVVAGPSDVIPEPTLLDKPLFNYTAEQMQSFADHAQQISQSLADMYLRDLRFATAGRLDAAVETAAEKATVMFADLPPYIRGVADAGNAAADSLEDLKAQADAIAADTDAALVASGRRAYVPGLTFEDVARGVGVSTPDGMVTQQDALLMSLGQTFSEEILSGADGFVSGILQAVQGGSIEVAFQSMFTLLGQAVSGVVTSALAGTAVGSVAGPIGALVGGLVGLTGGALFAPRPNRDEERESLLASQARTPSAIRLDFTFNQSNSLGLLDDPATRARLRDVSSEAFAKFEEVLQRNLVPRLQALEGRVFA